jgi:CRP-like cAMP-binding protein
MLTKSDVEFLGGLSIFAGLQDEVMQRIAAAARRVDLAPGQVLFEEGEPAKEMVVVLAGRLDVVKRGRSGGEAFIASIGPGHVAGEMSLIDIQPRSAAVRAVEPTSIMVLSHGDIARVYREDPHAFTLLVLNISREISLRLRRVDAMLANIMLEIRDATGRG